MGQGKEKRRFRILLGVVAAAGLTQGLLLPLMATLLEKDGVSSSMNGLHATALYLGVLLSTPFCGALVRRYGYRTVIGFGMVLLAGGTFLFPVMTGFLPWMVLRFVVGIGDSILHYASQLWITSESPMHLRGRLLSQYGLAFGIGFGLGPLGINLLTFGEWVPFVTMGALLLIVLVGIFLLEDHRPPINNPSEASGRRMVRINRMGFVALCPGFLYGFLEATLSGSFPVYGLREGLGATWVSILISAFVYGSLLFQLPLGALSDRWGRKRVLGWICFLGSIGMALIPFAIKNEWILLTLFTLVGGLLGSLFSLGLAFLADIVPVEDLPEANALSGAYFAIGCLVGPYVGGVLIQVAGGSSLFYLIAGTLFAFVMLTFLYRTPSPTRVVEGKDQEEVVLSR
ncbi:Predicted arabinose efflux permease, MFS family [Marininema mesophilum]|uniref:Predicted arabinose efflux permease, MFS family n=1 Tax=Marininema mesophilum TaxID=1048340 RepID=A0A1H2ZYA3_9BACL|nr:MFS transporter [Marininema mesophilum]SDX22522.1 Predicted arabinose efflux permease, MFS family [Marininema mesophilum]